MEDTSPLSNYFTTETITWFLIWLTCYILTISKHGIKGFDQDTTYMNTIHATGLCICSILTLSIQNETLFSESHGLFFSRGFFLVDLLDCIIRQDVVFSIHALMSLYLNHVCQLPMFYKLNCGSKGNLVELSTIPYNLWKKDKRRKWLFQLFAIVFLACRIIWVPIFLKDTFEQVKPTMSVVVGSVLIYVLFLVFFYKIVTVLMNYKVPNTKVD